jgi:hypothetical protein
VTRHKLPNGAWSDATATEPIVVGRPAIPSAYPEGDADAYEDRLRAQVRDVLDRPHAVLVPPDLTKPQRDLVVQAALQSVGAVGTAPQFEGYLEAHGFELILRLRS